VFFKQKELKNVGVVFILVL